MNLFPCAVLLLPAQPGLAPAPIKIVCLGDSVTKGVRPGVAPNETFCVLLARSLSKAGITAEVINAGVGGHTAADGLNRLDRDVLAHKPDYVVIMFGINDSWIDVGKTSSRATVAVFTADLRKLTHVLQQKKVLAVLMTPNPVTAPRYPPERNARLRNYVEAMRGLARDENLPIVDIYARFAELALEGTDLNTLFTDSMHPNAKGHAVIAGMLEEELERIMRKREKRQATGEY